jgi:hypothetical protein
MYTRCDYTMQYVQTKKNALSLINAKYLPFGHGGKWGGRKGGGEGTPPPSRKQKKGQQLYCNQFSEHTL